MQLKVEVAVPGADILGECPLWDERSRALRWVDSRDPVGTLYRLDTDFACEPLAGSVLVLKPGVSGLPESRFGG